MPLRKARSSLATAGNKTRVLVMAAGRFLFMDGGAFLEADFKVLEKVAPMLLGLVTQQRWGLEVNYQTSSVSVYGGFPLSLRRQNRHLYIHLELPEDSDGTSVCANSTHANPTPEAASPTTHELTLPPLL